MRGTKCADPMIDTFPAAAALPADAAALLNAAPGLFGNLGWWNVAEAHAMPPGAHPVFVTIRSGGQIAAVLPMLRTGRRLASFTTPYTCAYAPAIAPGLDQPGQIAVMAAFARFARSAAIVRLDAMPAEWDGLAALRAGARRAGLVPLGFDHFGNWHEDVTGTAWSTYLSQRPGALRETIRRRLRRAETLADARFDLFTRTEQMEQAATAFESVYDRSWKDAEPYPAFNVALMRATAASGQLRLGVWSIGKTPVAVQFWVVTANQAIVLKLAHDEAFKAHSPGTVLTALMLRYLLDEEHVTRIDFGRGDDAYKQGWTNLRRQRIGLVLANPASVAGVAALLRHAGGRLRAARYSVIA